MASHVCRLPAVPSLQVHHPGGPPEVGASLSSLLATKAARFDATVLLRDLM